MQPFESKHIRQIIIKDKQNNLFCLACEQGINEIDNEDQLINNHHISTTHLENLSLKFIKSLKGQQEDNQMSNLKLFDLSIAKKMQNKSKKDLRKYLSSCVKKIPNIFKGLSPSTVTLYYKILIQIFSFLLSKGENVISVENALSFLENQTNPSSLAVIKRFLFIYGLQLSDSFDQQFSRDLKQKKKQSAIPFSQLTQFSSEFLADLEKNNFNRECLAYLLAFNGMQIKKIQQLTFGELESLLQTTKDFNQQQQNFWDSWFLSSSIPRVMNKTKEYFGLNNNNTILDDQLTDRQSRKKLSKIRAFLAKQTDNKDYKEFLLKANLMAIQQSNRKRKVAEAENKIQQKETLTFSFIGSSIGDSDLSDIFDKNNDENNCHVPYIELRNDESDIKLQQIASSLLMPTSDILNLQSKQKELKSQNKGELIYQNEEQSIQHDGQILEDQQNEADLNYHLIHQKHSALKLKHNDLLDKAKLSLNTKKQNAKGKKLKKLKQSLSKQAICKKKIHQDK